MEAAARAGPRGERGGRPGVRGGGRALPGAPPTTPSDAAGRGSARRWPRRATSPPRSATPLSSTPRPTFAVAGGGALADPQRRRRARRHRRDRDRRRLPGGRPPHRAPPSRASPPASASPARAPIDLTQHALGDDRVAPFQVNADDRRRASTPPFDPPGEITGLTRHARRSAPRGGTAAPASRTRRWPTPCANPSEQPLLSRRTTVRTATRVRMPSVVPQRARTRS